MASKRKQTANMLNKSAAIDAQFQPAQSAQDAPKPEKRKTYLLTEPLIDRMAALAAAHRVGVNDMSGASSLGACSNNGRSWTG